MNASKQKALIMNEDEMRSFARAFERVLAFHPTDDFPVLSNLRDRISAELERKPLPNVEPTT